MALGAVPTDAELPRIRDGVFFTTPATLPRGRHGLPREDVSQVQRERLMIASTELLAARGYRGFGASEIAKRAGVSLGAFYDCFENKDQCIFAGYDRFIGVLLGSLGQADVGAGSRAELVDRLLGSYFEALERDPVVARAYQVEIDSLGAPARERRRTSLHAIARVIEQVTTGDEPARQLPPSAYIGVVYAARQLAADAFDREPEPDLSPLRVDLDAWLTDVFRVG